jgi:putative ABC transport system permease protein
MMRQILRIRAVFTIAIKRLFAQRLLSVATIIGLTVAVALILTIPVYSESVAFRLLTDRLSASQDQTSRPPFSFMFSYIGSWNDPVNWEDMEALDTFLRDRGGDELGLTTTAVIRHLETPNFRLYPSSETDYKNDNRSLDYVTFGTTEGINDHVELVDGTFPSPADSSPDSIVDVMIHEEFASEFGIQAGEIYVGYNWRLESDQVLQITQIRIAGIWRPINEDAPYWFYRHTVFSDILLVHNDTYKNRISPYSDEEINLGIWYLITDGQGVNTSRVDELIARHDETEKISDQLLTGTYIQASPVKELKPYQRIVSVLTLTLTVFSIPIVALLIVFLIMIVGLVVDRQRNETAVLRSRGASPFQVVGLAAVEGTIIGGIALVIGTGLATIFTQLMGSTRSFMDFSYESSFIVSFPPTIATTAALALLFTIIIRLAPTITASRHTIISYKLDNSRLLRRPIWQRLGIDILLLIIIGYFYYQIIQQGGLIKIEEGISNIEQAYDHPFVFLLPPLTIFAVTLFLLRVLPIVLRFISWIIQLTDSVGLLIVTRQLERSPGTYYLPLILLVSTISLGIYTSSFARTIDRYLFEQQFYRVAADMSVRVYTQSSSGFGGGAQEEDTAYMHISEFNSMDSIIQATRLGEYGNIVKLTSGNVKGKFIGVDRAEFGQVVFWRPDFASVRLGHLLNALAIKPDTVLISRDFMEDRKLKLGDFLQMDIKIIGETIPVSLQIVGTFNYFPHWFPEEDGPLFVGNLDYLSEQGQTELPHRIIARISPTFDRKIFTKEVVSRGAAGVLIDEPFSRIEREQSRPERQGLFGLLSIGFTTSSLATMIGFLLYTLFSYQRRYVELGILRAIGLSQFSMMISVAWELGLLILIGLSLGVAIGLFVSVLYIPYMQFVSNIAGIVPPYVVMIAWAEIAQIVSLFVLTFILIMAILLIILRRMRIFQAVKLGESL